MPAPLMKRPPGALARLLVAAWVVVAALLPGLHAASAQEEGPLLAYGLSMVGDKSRVRIIIRFDREPKMDTFLLRGPHRLVLDFAETRFGFKDDDLKPKGLVGNVQYGALDEGRSRVIFSFAGPFSIERRTVEEVPNGQGWRLIADIVSDTPAAFEKAMAGNRPAQHAARATEKTDRLGQTSTPGQQKPGGKFTVVLDPGHGGIDGGAEGAHGTVEKTITLAFALELRKKLEETGRFEVFMTRDDDTFLRLDERVRVGRQYGADLFLSIHADTIRYKYVRGATVYTVSEEASDEIAKAIAEKENLSDAIAGVELQEDSAEVADILLDLVRRETQTFSIRFARGLVGELSDKIELIKNPHRSAGFRVLLAHDMPSVLLEIGYLSNKDDEMQMRDAAWREKAVGSIVSAIKLYADARKGEDG
ncbi:MAG: N-acetylmuramoyl-L-alanine amidase [Notoacmeibacter sp.]|nr:N-acetylmuramoyl-L-alanine amidase [Notoacmeibacter sp.]MCC0031771.1 N-acetylmuramoyl-L-alanine amidase [Brucellaceae bacterium]